MPSLYVPASVLLWAILCTMLSILFFLYYSPLKQSTYNFFLAVRIGLLKSIARIIIFFQRIERRLSLNIQRKGDELYEELTPLDNADEDKAYDQQLKWALSKSAIRNIAITGTYGSGKSSVVKTFQKNHREYNYLNISLASFPESLGQNQHAATETSKLDSGNSKRTNSSIFDGQLVEFSILQQILLHIRHNRLPGSRFHRIRHQRRWKTIFHSLILSAFVFAGTSLFSPTFFDKLIAGFCWDNGENLANLLVYLFVLGFIVLTYSLLRTYSNLIISRVKIPAAEVEVNRPETSVLNRQIEEILYFFEVTNYDVVVIEDLDRFGNVEIFTKLREINLLINNAEQVKRAIVFVYVLGDHVFAQENRTKFFDYIIPVIPVVNSSNAYQLLTDRIQKAGFSVDISTQFIDEVSLFITDMRLLKNVMNEFNLYYAKLKAGKINSLNDTCLFSLVLFKNLYPQKFAELQNGKGLIVEIFNRKEELTKKLTGELYNKNIELNKLIQEDQQILLTSIEELRIVYLTKWINMNNAKGVLVGLPTGQYTVSQLTADALFAKVRQGSGATIQLYSRGAPTPINVDFEHAAGAIDPYTSYDQKEERLRARSNGQTEVWKKELAENTELIRLKNSLSLRLLLQQLSTNFVPEELKEHRLLEFLLRNGYINEEYPYYISHFYPGSLLLAEHEFILSVKEQKPKAFDYPLVNLDAILRRLYISDYRTEAILNFCLLNHLLQYDPPDSVRLKSVMQLLANGQETTTNFIDQYIQGGYAQTEAFVSLLAGYWKSWWSYLYQHPTATQEFKENGYRLLLTHASVPYLQAMNGSGEVSMRLSSFPDFPIPEDKLMSCLTELQVKVRDVEKEDRLSIVIVDHLIEYSLYEMNPKMIELLLRKKSVVAAGGPITFAVKPYSAVRESKLAAMNKYIESDINGFVAQVMLKLEGPLFEEESVLKELLLNATLELKYKEALIRKMGHPVHDLKEYGIEFWNILIEEGKVICSWDNLSVYSSYTEKDMERMIQFVNENSNRYNLKEGMNQGNVAFIETAPLLIDHPKTSKALFDEIVSSYTHLLSNINFEALDSYRLGRLLQFSLIPFNKENIIAIKKHSLQLVADFLVQNRESIISSPTSYDLDALDFLSLLRSGELIIAEKQELILNIPPALFDQPPLAREVVRSLILDGTELQFSTLLSVVQHNPDNELNVKLAIRQLERAPEAIDQLLEAIGGDYALLFRPDQKLSFPDSSNHKRLINLLKKRGYIIRTRQKDDSIKVFTKKS